MSKRQILKDVVLKGNMTKSEVAREFEKEKKFDHAKQQWFFRRYGKYYNMNHGTYQPQEGETEQEAEERFYALQPYLIAEGIQELKDKGIGIFQLLHPNGAKMKAK